MDTLWNIIIVLAIYIVFIRKILRAQIIKNPQSPRFVYILYNPIKELISYAGGAKSNIKTASFTSKNTSMFNIKGKILWIAGIILIIVIVMNIFIVIPAGQTGVRTLFGRVNEKEMSSGLHIIDPLENVERMSIRTEEYTMSITQGEGQKSGADQITALTNEGLQVDLDITVFYHLDEESASDVYKNLGVNYQEKIIRPEIRSAIREVVARYNAKDIYSEKRNEVADGIRTKLSETIDPRGIMVEQVLLRNVTLPASLSKSIQEKLQAEQESQRYEFVLQKETKEAERKRVEAAGQRDSQAIINESLSAKYLQYLYIKELKDRQGTIYVPTGADGLPIFKSVE
ncbi:MAG: prohibitin family protein [Parcubacteria group bacterium]|jgi:regulator of protease activity HflC (stomatin/prohibitin superfamily)